jgi:hypothetical protein
LKECTTMSLAKLARTSVINNWKSCENPRKINQRQDYFSLFIEKTGLWKVEVCEKYGANCCWDNVDSLVVVEALKRKTNSNVTWGALINQIRQLMDLDWEVDVQHAYRKVTNVLMLLQMRSIRYVKKLTFLRSALLRWIT